jgi:capsular exopolysaccharide synthesis family protein
VNRYSTTYERFQALAAAGDVTVARLSTLQPAESQPISQSEYNARITAGQLGNNHVRADLISGNTEDPLEPTGSSSTGGVDSPFARGALGAVLGILVGVGLALVAERIDRRIRTREEFEAAYGMPVLAEIPMLTSAEQRAFELSARTGPFSRAAEAYRAVRSSILFQRPMHTSGQLSTKALTIMVASATPKEGKSTTSANLAAIFAESGQRVLVMNCDFRRPTLHRFFGVENEPRHVLDTGIEGLMLVSDVTGPDNPNPAQVTDQQRRIITNSQEHFEVLILDTAPLLSTNDATELMDLVDLVVVVGRVGQSTSDNALRVRELLSRLDAPAAGVVMVGSDAATNEYYYYYSRGRAKELATEEPGAARSRSKSKQGTDGNGSNGDRSGQKPVSMPDITDA